ncbi:hypothetical protein BCR33DRAFT_710993 [Rhizoclosmatium globosum]|uniref:Uncharacterized protein n=1 Tax=Rhizoclosmatium globosum TaxID=329046 RepID=A0A1Y2D4T8_9FUNG|nr:hypothetical protein BCR33DRAFT_710993 [Rhizoclosmatium globosum]|eukprot:ORY53605.1 hypothetical protein BCR33DRAFT_710993 [Rhizoclosmatium globosum]
MALTFSSMMMALALENSMRGISLAVERFQDSGSQLVLNTIFAGNSSASSTSLDMFLLYKTWLLSSKNRLFLGVSVFIILFRMATAGRDLYLSYGFWDNQNCYCAWIAVPGSFNLYAMGDIAADILSTASTILIGHFYLKSDLSKLAKVLILENVIRSVCSLSSTAFVLWAVNQNNPNLSMYSAGSQAYINAQLLNLEFFWFKKRSAAVEVEADDVVS